MKKTTIMEMLKTVEAFEKYDTLQDAIEYMKPVQIAILLIARCSKERKFKEGKEYNFIDLNFETKKELKRWGGDFVIRICDGKIVKNTLYNRAWNWDHAKAKKQADNALLYFARQYVNDIYSLKVSTKNRYQLYLNKYLDR